MSSHRLVEGFLRRVAAHPEAEAFALRGGMLVHHWFPAMGRTVRDVDLVCGWPLDRPAVERELAWLLAHDVGDGVRFGARFRTDAIWPGTDHPGLRLVAPGVVDGVWGEVHADLTFRLPVWPEARPSELEAGVSLGLCRPETLIARKLTVTADRGPRAWRPKDLVDLWWMLEHGGVQRAELGEAIERTLSLERWQEGPARVAFWQDAGAAAGWGHFRRRHRGLVAPRPLGVLVAGVLHHLAPYANEAPCR